jgi:hypothetical protein
MEWTKGLTENSCEPPPPQGLKKYRLQHLKYDLHGSPQVAEFAAQLKTWPPNKEIGIQGFYRNHRGKLR